MAGEVSRSSITTLIFPFGALSHQSAALYVWQLSLACCQHASGWSCPELQGPRLPIPAPTRVQVSVSTAGLLPRLTSAVECSRSSGSPLPHQGCSAESVLYPTPPACRCRSRRRWRAWCRCCAPPLFCAKNSALDLGFRALSLKPLLRAGVGVHGGPGAAAARAGALVALPAGGVPARHHRRGQELAGARQPQARRRSCWAFVQKRWLLHAIVHDVKIWLVLVSCRHAPAVGGPSVWASRAGCC